jgi:beta-aspartyl-peptidase (threonine type)
MACLEDLRKNGGIGGVIVLDESGNCECFCYSFNIHSNPTLADSMPLTCEGMFRGVIKEDGEAKVAIFRDDLLA